MQRERREGEGGGRGGKGARVILEESVVSRNLPKRGALAWHDARSLALEMGPLNWTKTTFHAMSPHCETSIFATKRKKALNN